MKVALIKPEQMSVGSRLLSILLLITPRWPADLRSFGAYSFLSTADFKLRSLRSRLFVTKPITKYNIVAVRTIYNV